MFLILSFFYYCLLLPDNAARPPPPFLVPATVVDAPRWRRAAAALEALLPPPSVDDEDSVEEPRSSAAAPTAAADGDGVLRMGRPPPPCIFIPCSPDPIVFLILLFTLLLPSWLRRYGNNTEELEDMWVGGSRVGVVVLVVRSIEATWWRSAKDDMNGKAVVVAVASSR